MPAAYSSSWATLGIPYLLVRKLHLKTSNKNLNGKTWGWEKSELVNKLFVLELFSSEIFLFTRKTLVSRQKKIISFDSQLDSQHAIFSVFFPWFHYWPTPSLVTGFLLTSLDTNIHTFTEFTEIPLYDKQTKNDENYFRVTWVDCVGFS